MLRPCVVCKGGQRCCRDDFCPFGTNPVAYAFVVPALRKVREGRATRCAGRAREIKSLGHPADELG